MPDLAGPHDFPVAPAETAPGLLVGCNAKQANMKDSTSKRTGTLYLIPSSLGESDLSSVWPEGNRLVILALDAFIVETCALPGVFAQGWL